MPPSIGVSDAKAGNAYQFERGSWDELPRLPDLRILPENLPDRLAGHHDQAPRSSKSRSSSAAKVQLGHRNDTTFSRALRFARGCESLSELIDEVRHYNTTDNEPPLTTSEIDRICRSAWRYESEGRNYAGDGGLGLSHRLMDRLRDPNAYWLFAHLHRAHGMRDTPFAISLRAMAAAGSIPGLGERGIRRARDVLLEAGVIKRVREGGHSIGDPHLYVFGNLSWDEGA